MLEGPSSKLEPTIRRHTKQICILPRYRAVHSLTKPQIENQIGAKYSAESQETGLDRTCRHRDYSLEWMNVHTYDTQGGFLRLRECSIVVAIGQVK